VAEKNLVLEKIPKQFRLSRDVVKRLEEVASLCSLDQTEIVEEAIRCYAAEVADTAMKNRIKQAEAARRELGSKIKPVSSDPVSYAAKVLADRAVEEVRRDQSLSRKPKAASTSGKTSGPKLSSEKQSKG
jgi:predicted transcriptional regulator